MTPRHADRIIKSAGITGFGGNCGLAAVLINKVVFDGAGTLVVAANEFLFERGRTVGHAAVLYNGHFYDAEGLKSEDEITSWAMLDENDSDYFSEEDIQQHGVDIAYEVVLWEMSAQEVLDHLGGACTADPAEMEQKLRAAMQIRRASVRWADKMDAVDLKALKRTPVAWQQLMARFPETLVRELMVERPRPDYRDVEEISEWRLASPVPVEVQLSALVQDPENQRSVNKAPPDVVDEINALWGTAIAVGPQLDLNPGRYRAYAEQPASSAKPSVLVDGTVLFGVARFVAALLRGDKTLKVWDLRTTNPQSSRNGYAAVRRHGVVYPLER